MLISQSHVSLDPVEKLISNLKEQLTPNGNLKLYVRPGKEEAFEVRLHVRDVNLDFICSKSNIDLGRAVSETVGQIRHRLAKAKDKRIASRRKQGRVKRESFAEETV